MTLRAGYLHCNASERDPRDRASGLSRIRRAVPARLAWLSIAAAASGCGGDTAGQSGAVATAVGEVVTGAQNISSHVISSSTGESETAAVGLGGTYAVAYNTFNAAIPGERCAGYSELGMSYAGYPRIQAIHFATPSNIAVLRGDPSIAMWDAGSSYQVFVSTLAISQSIWSRASKTADGCVSRGTFDSLPADMVCVFTVSMPKSGTTVSGATVTGSVCEGAGFGQLDGTAVTAYNGTFYAASWVSDGSVLMISGDGSGQRMVPFGRSIHGHPIWTKNSPLDMFAPDSQGQFWEIWYSPSTGTWSAPLAAPSGYAWEAGLPYGMRGGKEYAAAYLPGSAGPGATYLFFQSGNQILGYSHASGGIPGWTQVFSTSAAYRSFHPAVAVATIPNQYPPYSGFHLGLTFWNNSGPGGSASLRYTTGTLTAISNLATETPCPYESYWGDYDEMFVLNDRTSNPTFYRAFTDSTGSACLTPTSDWSTNTPQHVSIIAAPTPIR